MGETFTTLLPLIVNTSTPKRMDLGAQVWPGTLYPSAAVDRSNRWLVPGAKVLIPVWWDDIETSPGAYDWAGIKLIMDALTEYDVILSVKNAPIEYRTIPEIESSEPTEEGKLAYVVLLQEMASRFSVWGFELWNEPDTKRIIEIAMSKFIGAWGNTFEDGQGYGEFVELCCANLPDNIKILAGALGWPDQSEFIHGFLDVSSSFDYLSYHKYIHADWGEGEPFWKYEELSNWISSLTNKPLYVTETSYLYTTASEENEQRQADFLRYILHEIPYSMIMGVLWYTLYGNGWQNSDLDEKEVKTVWREELI